jgi:hypothetical protein
MKKDNLNDRSSLKILGMHISVEFQRRFEKINIRMNKPIFSKKNYLVILLQRKSPNSACLWPDKKTSSKPLAFILLWFFCPKHSHEYEQ